ncbi:MULTISPECIES: putative quinol monooxygenase [unclassified Shinella]|uniref:putative quinol monooxygenase n=1 Tax=unclassified Shinella TaxID=2643062 RepID=UPI00225D8136|nr:MULTISPECIES: putative quinol monooxygenase [unclassified Shinella]MCO5140175.1 antibiotic biosynthesis monooxygenase [Shinella sp.]MDC7256807.1 antibiotic biosynthesis monooxygenase [Shinella sp. YE25]CAI0339691.1 Antibiotic biosynthesis monooxygenase [Rhizobiaceae bacterium]CAK7258083.1 Antibiotic biosynthesis monooxygenase [Shinella sp. WSC3-e]
MTVTVVATIVARPEMREELYHLLAAQVAPTRAEVGCLNYDFHVDATDPCIFVFYENWRSEADLGAHMAMLHLKPLLEQAERLVAKPIEVRRLIMISKEV